MERTVIPPAEAPPAPSVRASLAAIFLLIVLIGWHGWRTLGLFGGDWNNLVDERPVLSGRHPQHLYIGTRGAQSLSATGNSCCYDSAFDGGYPKTPIYNGGRLAEAFLFVAGGEYQPAAYKIGLAAMCLLAPILLLVAAVAAGLTWPATLLATLAGLMVWWGPPCQTMLLAGDFDMLFASLTLLAHAGMLLWFDRNPGFLSWFGLVLTAAAGWFAQPLVFPLLVPLFLMYYLTIGARHRFVGWHLGLWLGETTALALNAFWLIDWVQFWWLRAPLPRAEWLLEHRTLQTVWESPVWGGSLERGVSLALLGSALIGVVLLHRAHRRAAARVYGLGAVGLWALALAGIAWEPLGQIGTSALLAPALWFACVPAAHAWSRVLAGMRWLLGRTVRVAVVCSAVLACLAFVIRDEMGPLAERFASRPFTLGLGPEHAEIIEKLTQYTDSSARILWEDSVGQARSAPRFAPLLQLSTRRAFIGGLDPERTIEHATIGLMDGALAGLPISAWSDGALEEYCRRYNVGWVVCSSPAAIARFEAWKEATPICEMKLGRLFSLRPETRSYVLRGRAQVVHADHHHITLADVVPDGGMVVLSFHYQTGLRASPARVLVERDPHPTDPAGFVRLRLSSPVPRVTLTWDGK